MHLPKQAHSPIIQYNHILGRLSSHTCQGTITKTVTFEVAPPMIHFEFDEIQPLCVISSTLQLPLLESQPATYDISGIIYCSHSHFTADIQIGQDWFTYDGMNTGGILVLSHGPRNVVVNESVYSRRLA